MRLALETGPLAVFFLANWKFGIMTGTSALIVATLVSALLSYRIERKLPIMPLVSCVFVSVFGGLTLWLGDDMFIKLKPTVANLLFATVLSTGLVLRRNVMKPLLGGVLSLTEEGWRRLSLRWACFFVVLAVLNEVVWRSQSTDIWVDFKVFAIMPLTLAFSACQLPLILKHQRPDGEAP